MDLTARYCLDALLPCSLFKNSQAALVSAKIDAMSAKSSFTLQGAAGRLKATRNFWVGNGQISTSKDLFMAHAYSD